MQFETIGPYQVNRLLAAGGMAEVFLAYKMGPGGFKKQVVLKRIGKKLLGDKEIHSMFLDEARVQSLLDHPNIVQIHDFGEVKGSYYLVMELVAGCTLRWLIDNGVAVGRRIPLQHALRISSDILAGLHFAHEKMNRRGEPLHLIHRDISPVNILIGRHGMAKICDFGVAKSQLQSVFTRAGLVKGKFRYMSPEQINSEKLDRRSDVFSVGICLWEMLVGRRLFDHPSETGVAASIRSGVYPAVSRYRSDIPRALDRILSRALSLSPRDRFSSARDFQTSCESLLQLLPKPSNSILLGDYVTSEMDGTVQPAKTNSVFTTQTSEWASGFEALDPPVPQGPTQVASRENTDFVEDTEMLPPPSIVGKAVGMALMAPAGAFAGVTKTLAVIENAFSKKEQKDQVQITRTSPDD
jgi:eukaryotic-like serine/threonine-protein kinase